jgi:hypothetical protein
MPENPNQIIFLLAAASLSACFGRIWLIQPSSATLDAIGPLSGNDLERWVRLTQVFGWPMLLAGVGAYFCCFSRRENPLKYWLSLVVVPALLGIAGGSFVPALVALNGHPRSVLEKYDRNPFHGIRFPLRALVLNAGTGFRLAVLGLLLALVGSWLLRTGRGSLPIGFGPSSLAASTAGFVPAFSRMKIFAIYTLTLASFGGNLLSSPVASILTKLFSRTPATQLGQVFGVWLSAAQFLLYTLAILLIALWALGENRPAQLLESARLPPAGMLGLALVLPLAAHWLPHVLAYAIDRVAWAQHWSATPDAPLSSLYLHAPPIGPHLILIAVAAALSEWCWRGCIQPQFIRAFGIFRGIFIVGVLYGSVQLLLFPSVAPGLPGFFFHLALQLSWGIVWSIVFGWLTLYAASVWPAAISAAMSSMLTQAALTDSQEIIPRQFFRLCLLATGCVIAFLMVRYLPLAPNQSPQLIQSPATPESSS